LNPGEGLVFWVFPQLLWDNALKQAMTMLQSSYSISHDAT